MLNLKISSHISNNFSHFKSTTKVSTRVEKVKFSQRGLSSLKFTTPFFSTKNYASNLSPKLFSPSFSAKTVTPKFVLKQQQYTSRFFCTKEEKDKKEAASSIANNNEQQENKNEKGVKNPAKDKDEDMEEDDDDAQLAEEGEEDFIDHDKETEQLYEKSPLLDFSESFKPLGRSILKKLTSAIDENKYESIMEEVVKEIEKNPQNPELYYLKAGIQMEWMHLKDDALVSLNKAIEIDPKYYRAHLLKGYCQFRSEKMDEAVAALNEAIAVSTNPHDTAYVLKLDALLRKKSPEADKDGVKTASDAIQKGEKFPEKIEKERGADEKEGVLEAFSIPDMYHFHMENIYQYKAAFQSRLGDYMGALITLQEGSSSTASDQEPKKRKVRELVGNTFYLLGNGDEAESRWQEVYERDPWNMGARLNSLLVQYEAKNGPVPQIKDYIRADLEYSLVVSLNKAEETKKLLEFFQTQAKPSPLTSEITAFLHGVRLDRDQALQVFGEVLKSNPDHKSVNLSRGALFQFQAKYDEAIEEYRKALGKIDKEGEEVEWKSTASTAITDALLTCYSDAGRWKELLKFGMTQWDLQDQADLHHIMHVGLHKLNVPHKCTPEDITEEDLASYPDAKPEDLADDPEFMKLFPKVTKGKKGQKQSDEDEDDEDWAESEADLAEGGQKQTKSEESAEPKEKKKGGKEKKAKKDEEASPEASGEDKKAKKKGGKKKKSDEFAEELPQASSDESLAKPVGEPPK